MIENLKMRVFVCSESNERGVTDEVYTNKVVLGLEGRASLGEDVLKKVELEEGVVLKVTDLGNVLPAVVGAEGWVSNVDAGLGGKDLTIVEDNLEEGDLRKKVAESILDLNLTSVELVTNLSENVEIISLSDSVGVSVVEGEPQRNDVEGLNVNVELAEMVAEEVQSEANVGIRPKLKLNPVVNDGIASSWLLIGGETVAEIEVSIV